MSSKGVLYIIVSGPDSHQRAIEGLRMAEYQSGDGKLPPAPTAKVLRCRYQNIYKPAGSRR